MRFTRTAITLSTTFILTAGIATAADAPREFQYLSGDVAGIEQNAIGTMELESVSVLILHGPTATFEIPYAAVTKSGRKVAAAFDDKEPLYKFWALGKRLMPLLPVEHVTLEFTDKTGKPASMTIEMYQQHADKIMARIERAEARNAINRGEFWGDRVWKTKRNQDSWGGVGEVATRE
jgi:hypothetical protein